MVRRVATSSKAEYRDWERDACDTTRRVRYNQVTPSPALNSELLERTQCNCRDEARSGRRAEGAVNERIQLGATQCGTACLQGLSYMYTRRIPIYTIAVDQRCFEHAREGGKREHTAIPPFTLAAPRLLTLQRSDRSILSAKAGGEHFCRLCGVRIDSSEL